MTTIVEGMLPAQFLLDLGKYMQTAAHIELAVWQTTMHAKGIDLHSVEEFQSYANLKLRTQEMLGRFRGCADLCPPSKAARIRTVADELGNGLEARNLAAHGAFFRDDQDQSTLVAVHFFARGRGKDREVFEVKQTFSRQTVEDAIVYANQLLHELIAL